jgi:hypothetical protein
MLLYHFTCVEYLPAILRIGLSRGEVPYSAVAVGNAVNLTIDPIPEGNGVYRGWVLSDEDRAVMARINGVEPPPGARFPDKTAIRIEIKMQSSDPNLVCWLPFARKRLEPAWFDRLHAGHKPEKWWLYFGTIQPSAFSDVCERDGDNYRPIKR